MPHLPTYVNPPICHPCYPGEYLRDYLEFALEPINFSSLCRHCCFGSTNVDNNFICKSSILMDDLKNEEAVSIFFLGGLAS